MILTDEEAIACYDASMDADKKIGCDENTMTLYSKATSLIELGRDKEAKQCVDRAEELDPEGPPQP